MDVLVTARGIIKKLKALPRRVNIGEARNVGLMDRFLQNHYVKSVSAGQKGNSSRGSCSSHEKRRELGHNHLSSGSQQCAIALIKSSGRRHDDLVKYAQVIAYSIEMVATFRTSMPEILHTRYTSLSYI
ncbi:unnamed protein product [Dovyalis caffra]|uniref:Ribosomal protein S7 n=1 Tax=Dovyalis caffra TaxID=77055 RepID=A0AAV1S3B4_9ROSI|nr:unnamed protein product [Dovyalis caffra]